MDELLSQIVGYLRDMWRFRWWGLALSWVVGIVGGAVIYMMPDKYESTARVYVDTQSVLRPLMSGLAVEPNVDQQVAILSRTLINRPNVERLITMADLDLKVQDPAQRERLIEDLTRSLQIRGTGRDNLFTLAYRDTHPERAQRVVQALVSLFVESGLVNKRQDTDAARRFIEEQIASYEAKLTEAENRRKDFRLKNMALLGDGGRDYVSQVGQLNQLLSQARLDLLEAQNSRDALRRQLVGEEPVLLPEKADRFSTSIPEIDGRIDALYKNLDALLQRYTEEHPDVIGTRRVIADLEKQRDQEIEARAQSGGAQLEAVNTNPVFQQMKLALADAEARVASLTARVGEYEARQAALKMDSERLPEIEAEMAQLNRDYEINKRNYESLVARRESATISGDMSAQSGIAEFRQIDPPTLPTRPSAPNRVLLMPLLGIGGLALGMILTFFVSQLRPAFNDTRALRDSTGLPVLGTVSILTTPERMRLRRKGLLAFLSGIGAFVFAIAVATVVIKLLQN